MRTYHPACDLETQKIVWSCHKFYQQLMYNETPQVYDSVFLANVFADRYAGDVKLPTF